MNHCACARCRYAPSPKVIGDAHEIAVVLYLNAESAKALAGAMAPDDLGSIELDEAVTAWEAEVANEVRLEDAS